MNPGIPAAAISARGGRISLFADADVCAELFSVKEAAEVARASAARTPGVVRPSHASRR